MPDIQILTARAHRLLAPIISQLGALYAKGEPCILLVPEQFTLQAEREIMDRLKLEGFFTIQVLSPSRLSDHVLVAAGSDERKPLDDAGRQMAIGRALERCEDKLVYYRSAVHRRGFVEKLAALFTDLKRGELTPDSFRAYADSLTENGDKYRDIATIYAAYESLLQKKFSDGDDQLRYIASRLPKSGLLSGQSVFVYGFDALPQQHMQLLSAIAPLCARLTVALISDGESAPDGELYLPVRQGIARFMAMISDQGLSARLRALPPEPLRAAPVIQHLDRALFAYPSMLDDGPQKNVFLSVSQSPFEEATLVARQILRLCSEGMEIERIAVMIPDQNGYAFSVAAALRDSGLPFYTDQKLPATSHGLIHFLLCALRAVATGYRNEDMLGILKSGYASFSFGEACTLENYIISYGIDRARWTRPFAKGEDEQRLSCEAMRLRLMEPLLRLREELVAARDAQASLAAVFGLLQSVNAYEALKEEEEALLAEGLTVRANQNSQVWQAILHILEQLHALSGNERVPLKHIASRLEAGFSTISLASLPPASHMLQIGTLGHSLSGEMDAVFILGLNDGVLTRSADSLLSEDERAKTQEATGAFLGLTDESRNLFAKLDLKRAMTLPSHLLFLSYAKTAPDGTALRPLSLLSMLQKRVLSQLSQGPVPANDLPLSSAQALAELSVRLRAYADGTGDMGTLPPYWQRLLSALLAHPATAEKSMRLLRAANHQLRAAQLRRADAQALFGGGTLSVSRLEQFAECPFKHFVNYGLRPQIVEEWKVKPLDTGNFYHASLNNFAKLSKTCETFPHIGTETIEALADEAIAPLMDEFMQGPMGDGARSRALFESARQTVRRAAVTFTRHMAAGDFQVDQTEATFGYPGGMPPIALILSDGREVLLRGKIDRIDRYDTSESVYLRVIDYKSSKHDLDAARTWWGLQLQLFLYLDACVSATPSSLPAGAFYFYVADPLIESDTDLQTAVERELQKTFQLRGIALSDVEILHAMDGQETPVVLPKMLDKEGAVTTKAKALDLSQMQALLAHTREVAAALAEGIFSGQTDIRPTQSGIQTACDYCDFRPICGFDPDIPDHDFRHVSSMDMAELRKHLSPTEE